MEQISFKINNSEPTWMQEMRKKAFDSYVSLALPSFTYGLRVGVSVDLDFDKLQADCKDAVKVISDGDVIVKTFSEALEEYPAMIRQLLGTVVSSEDKFRALHYAMMNRLILVYAPRNTSGTVRLDFPCSGTATFDHVLVFAEEGSDVKVISSSSGSCSFRSEVVEVITHANARLHYTHVHSMEGISFSVKQAHCAKDACVTWMEGCMKGKLIRSQVVNVLQGPGASGYNYGLFYGNADQVFDLVSQNIHEVGDTTSNMLTKGALTDNARAVYRGLVKVNAGARNSNGYQKQETLLLSKNAHVDIIPDLVINNNEVKCSHGATIKRLGEEELFYLRSRGLDKKQAEGKLVEGFFEDMIRKLGHKEVEEQLRKEIANNTN